LSRPALQVLYQAMSFYLYPFLPSPQRDGGVHPQTGLAELYVSSISFDIPRMDLSIYHISECIEEEKGTYT